QEGAQKIWERYFAQLIGLARKKLQSTPRRVADEEDVALSAFDSFCRGAERGRFPRLDNRDDLWQLLIMITERKAYDLANHERRLKRGGGKVFAESLPVEGDSMAGDASGGPVADREPTPAFAAQAAEEFQRLLGLLGDATLQSVAVWKMEGYTTEEIA